MSRCFCHNTLLRVQSEQQPVKHVKSIKRSPSKGTSRHNIGDEEDIPDEQEMPPGIEAPLFGEWQTERYRAAPAKDVSFFFFLFLKKRKIIYFQ